MARREGLDYFSECSKGLLSSLDAVDISTPPSTHFQLAKRCLPYTNVFLEKPIALSVKEALQLDQLAKRYKRVLFAGHIYRFNTCLKTLKQYLDKSATRPFLAVCIMSDKPDVLPDDCGILYSDLHGFDIFDYLFERQPRNLYSMGMKLREDSTSHDTVSILMNYGPDLMGEIHLQWNALPKTRRLELYFPDKKLSIDLLAQKISIFEQKKKRIIKMTKPKTPLLNELNFFLSALKDPHSGYPDALLGARIVHIAAQAERSLLSGKPVRYQEI